MRNSPPLALDCPAPPLAQALWLAWCCALASGLAAASVPAGLRLAAALLLALAWGAGARRLAAGAAGAVRRLGWSSAEGWWLETRCGRRHYVQAGERAAQACGPWLLLRFRHHHRHIYVILARSVTEPERLCALKTVLALRGHY